LATWRLPFGGKPLIYNRRTSLYTRQLVTFCRSFSNLWRQEALNLYGIMNIQVIGKLGV
jgi:hypothetical protein